jgi:ABC-type lipopolysaccharide export system ATPase subunit
MVPEALALATRAHLMSKGELIFSGSPSELDQDDILKRCVGSPLNGLGEV